MVETEVEYWDRDIRKWKDIVSIKFLDFNIPFRRREVRTSDGHTSDWEYIDPRTERVMSELEVLLYFQR